MTFEEYALLRDQKYQTDYANTNALEEEELGLEVSDEGDRQYALDRGYGAEGRTPGAFESRADRMARMTQESADALPKGGEALAPSKNLPNAKAIDAAILAGAEGLRPSQTYYPSAQAVTQTSRSFFPRRDLARPEGSSLVQGETNPVKRLFNRVAGNVAHRVRGLPGEVKDEVADSTKPLISGADEIKVIATGDPMTIAAAQKKKAAAEKAAGDAAAKSAVKPKNVTTAGDQEDPKALDIASAARLYNEDWKGGQGKIRDEVKKSGLNMDEVRVEARRQRRDPGDAKLFNFEGEDAAKKTRALRDGLAKQGMTPLKFAEIKTKIGRIDRQERVNLEKAMQEGDFGTVIGMAQMHQAREAMAGKSASYGMREAADRYGDKSADYAGGKSGQMARAAAAVQELDGLIKNGTLSYEDIMASSDGKPLNIIKKTGVGNSEVNLPAIAAIVTRKDAELNEAIREAKAAGADADLVQATLQMEQWKEDSKNLRKKSIAREDLEGNAAKLTEWKTRYDEFSKNIQSEDSGLVIKKGQNREDAISEAFKEFHEKRRKEIGDPEWNKLMGLSSRALSGR
jgi:hypothetical protein